MTDDNKPIQPIPLGEHEGHKIYLNARKRFTVEGPVSATRLFADHPAYSDAIAAIDKAVKAKRKATQTNINLEVLTEHGQIAHIRSIHSSRGKVLFTDSDIAKKLDYFHLYPHVQWIANRLAHLRQLLADVETIQKELKPFQINGNRTYGSTSAEQLDGLIDHLKAEHATKLAKAIAEAPKPARAPSLAVDNGEK